MKLAAPGVEHEMERDALGIEQWYVQVPEFGLQLCRCDLETHESRQFLQLPVEHGVKLRDYFAVDISWVRVVDRMPQLVRYLSTSASKLDALKIIRHYNGLRVRSSEVGTLRVEISSIQVTRQIDSHVYALLGATHKRQHPVCTCQVPPNFATHLYVDDVGLVAGR